MRHEVGAFAVVAVSLLAGACAGNVGSGGASAGGKGSDAAARVVPAPSASPPGPRLTADCPGCPQLVLVPAGRFTMGEDGGEPERYEGPVREIMVRRAFMLARHEVTNAQYREFVVATGHRSSKGCHVRTPEGGDALDRDADWADPRYGRTIADTEPVVCVSWNDAQAYVSWLARRTGRRYRLPSEAEWEYAARAGTTGRYTWGEHTERACDVANVFDATALRGRPQFRGGVAPCDDGFAGVAPVGRFAPNAFGLHDMIGNVWEWVEDCYEMPHSADAPRDGSAQLVRGCDRHGSRGGSWGTALERQRPAFRGRDPATRVSQVFGFRIAREP